jgi:hypothetical protein
MKPYSFGMSESGLILCEKVGSRLLNRLLCPQDQMLDQEVCALDVMIIQVWDAFMKVKQVGSSRHHHPGGSWPEPCSRFLASCIREGVGGRVWI